MPDIRHSIQIVAPAEAVYAIVSTAKGWAGWWAADITESESTIQVAFFNRQTIYRLRPTVREAPCRSEWICETGAEWSGTRLLFRLDRSGTGTLLRFTHADWMADTAYFVNCTTTWGELMFRIKAAAEGKPRGPLFLTDSLAY
ncbi:MAG TPA: hypothetical protein VMU61_12330 [Candidatus Aquilonibacter sp.]|nr:hypothetical protein [Candidatus Aquilonibacter sp.]